MAGQYLVGPVPRSRTDELAAWRAMRHRNRVRRRRTTLVLRALFAGVFLVGALGGYLVATGEPPWRLLG